MSTRPIYHPPIESIHVASVLYALADPVRLAIVNQLKTSPGGMSCIETMSRVDASLPKSTCSLHFQILREAGLIQSERRGVELTSQVRSKELEARFPGLMESILQAYQQEQKKRKPSKKTARERPGEHRNPK